MSNMKSSCYSKYSAQKETSHRTRGIRKYCLLCTHDAPAESPPKAEPHTLAFASLSGSDARQLRDSGKIEGSLSVVLHGLLVEAGGKQDHRSQKNACQRMQAKRMHGDHAASDIWMAPFILLLLLLLFVCFFLAFLLTAIFS